MSTTKLSRSRRSRLTHAVLEVFADVSAGRSLHQAEIAQQVAAPLPELQDVLAEMVFDGLLIPRTGRRFRLSKQAKKGRGHTVEGTFTFNPRGFGFVKPAGLEDDLFIPEGATGGALHGDTVVARVVSQNAKGLEGAIERIVSRKLGRVVGLLRGGRKGRGFLVPDDTRIRGPIEVIGPAEGAELPPMNLLTEEPAAGVQLTRFPASDDENPQGELIAILGTPGEPDVEVAKILVGHEVDEDFPDAVLAEAVAYGDAVPPEVLAAREDLTDVELITIDPSDARDHDDAVWVGRDDDGSYDVIVAIADVAHYVRPGTALDEEAKKRSFSVYLPDRAVPMLPPSLSGSLCSLVEGKDRLCTAVHIRLDATGKVLNSRVIEGKMRSRAFLTYDAVARALGFTTEPARDPRAEARRHDLQTAWDLASILRKNRMRRGALQFELPEAKIDVDDTTREPVTVAQRRQDPGVSKAYRLIEEMMLLANETIARHMLRRGLPTVFRVHGAPDPDKLERFSKACEVLGIDFDASIAADPKALSKFLRKLEAEPKADILQGLLLRAMQQAVYDTVNGGHFGLASDAYVHFTSPIRRYPDLLVHRVLKDWLNNPDAFAEGGDDDDEAEEADSPLRTAALHASARQRVVMDVEREVDDLYRALYMKRHIGDVFEGHVTAITGGGLFLKVEDPFVDIFVPYDALGRDAFDPDDSGLFVRAKRSGERIDLGQLMPVVVEDISPARRMVFGRRLAPISFSAEDLPPRPGKKPFKSNRNPPGRKSPGGVRLRSSVKTRRTTQKGSGQGPKSSSGRKGRPKRRIKKRR